MFSTLSSCLVFAGAAGFWTLLGLPVARRVLARVRTATGYTPYPVPQGERDLLFARYRVEALT